MIYAFKKNGEVHFKAKKPPKKTKFIELSDDEHRKIINRLNDGGHYKRDIAQGKMLIIPYTPEITWDQIRSEADGILRRTKDAVAVPDYHIDGIQITQQQIHAIISYRAKLWTIHKDFEAPADVVWPEPPFNNL